MRSSTLVTCLLLAGAGCDGARHQQSPPVQHSAEARARWVVDLNRVRDGVYRTYSPRCLDGVKPGQTVEFRNFLPGAPANVTSIAGPETLYSPNLVRPYNFVDPEDPANALCDSMDAAGHCVARPAYTFWRFTFAQPGVYDWLDSNQGEPGRKVVDPYYGTATFVGTDPNTPTGTICVQAPDGSGCEGVCCETDQDCPRGTRCLRSEVDAVGQCRTPSG